MSDEWKIVTDERERLRLKLWEALGSVSVLGSASWELLLSVVRCDLQLGADAQLARVVLDAGPKEGVVEAARRVMDEKMPKSAALNFRAACEWRCMENARDVAIAKAKAAEEALADEVGKRVDAKHKTSNSSMVHLSIDDVRQWARLEEERDEWKARAEKAEAIGSDPNSWRARYEAAVGEVGKLKSMLAEAKSAEASWSRDANSLLNDKLRLLAELTEEKRKRKESEEVVSLARAKMGAIEGFAHDFIQYHSKAT